LRLPPGCDLGVRVVSENKATALPPPLLPKDRLPLIPQPKEWKPSDGTLLFTAIAPLAGTEAAAELALRLGLEPLTDVKNGLTLTVNTDKALGEEAYHLSIMSDGLAVVVGGSGGLHYAAITLLTLRETCNGKLPCGIIMDSPRFGWRGQHLDCARHYFSVPFILRLLDLMALLKLNRFHWHFADDESFRLQVKCYPAIWQKTAYRGEGELVPGVGGGGVRSGGSYSKADVAKILARAKALHIEVLPEIEVPAHSYAMIMAIPGLRDPDDNGKEVSVHGYFRNIVNPAQTVTWHLLEKLAEEVSSLFTIGILHLGADELPRGAWDSSPAVVELKEREGLVNSDDVQGWMLARLAGLLFEKGIRTAAWEEAAKGVQGGIGNDALLFSWNGQSAGIQAARNGYEVVMCPAQNTYFDLAHSDDPDDWGAAWAGHLPLEKTVDWDPVPHDAEDISSRIVGIESCFWGEFTTEDIQAEAMIAPRILGIATKAWEPKGTTDGNSLRVLARYYRKIFNKIGWQYNRQA
jgi:hexosaminidase